MTKVAQIEDRGATTAWSPIRSHSDVIALGTKDSGGIGFEDTGSELEIYDLGLSNSESQKQPKLMGSVKTENRFASLDWSLATDKFPMGLIAGGMENGVVNIWDAKKIVAGNQAAALLASFSNHASGTIKALQFNKLQPLQLASGGSDGKVLVFTLDPAGAVGGKLDKNATVIVPCESKQQHAQITSIAWNTQVAHVVASGASDGTVAVWDLKSRKAWCELRAEQSVSDMAWNPTQGLHLITASSQDSNPIIKLWDLRTSTSMPLGTLEGHNQGVLSLSWCPHDDQLLLSTGKDNRTILWDLFALKPIGDIPNDASETHQDPAAGPDNLFGSGVGGLATSQQRRYEVEWSPIKRGVALTCSFDRKVQAHSLLGLASLSGRPPKWLRPSSGVACGFGGAVVSFGALDKVVRIQTVAEETKLAEISLKFESELGATNVIQFCAKLAASTRDPAEAQMWGFMKVIFETNARQQLLGHLGFDAAGIAKAAERYANGEVTNGVAKMSLDGSKPSTGMSKGAEEIVKKALLIGDFQTAVDCCFQNGNLADALMLSSCGGDELWASTQKRFFDQEKSKRPYLSIVSAIIHNDLENMINESDPARWQETLAILSTYGKSEEFPQLCIALGDLLEKAGDARSASLCFMCALSLDRTIQFWRSQLSTESKGGFTDLLALHKFVMKVSIFLTAIGPSAQPPEEDGQFFAKYADRLSEQGLFATAAKYCMGESLEIKLLRDRLYRSRASPRCLAAMGGVPPEFPFTMANIQQSRGQVIVTHSVQQYQQQQQPIQHQQQASQQQQQAAQLDYSQHSTSHHSQGGRVTPAVHAPQPAPAASDTLPEGWMALQDPSSGNTYYANQTTGEVTWDKPQAAPIVQPPATDPYTTQYAAAAQEQPAQVRATISSDASTPSRLASKYGDGFVTSASHPELAYQYGNVGTSNPYSNTSRPGTAAVAGRIDRAPVSGTLNFDKIAELPAEYHPIRDCLLSLMEAINQTQLSGVDKRQMAEAEKATAVLLKRLTRGDIPADIIEKVNSMTNAIINHDFRGAQSIQTGLVNTDWKDHKDWLKGIKALLQLAAKRF